MMTKVFQVTTLASDARELADNITEWTDDQTLANVFEGQCGVRTMPWTYLATCSLHELVTVCMSS